MEQKQIPKQNPPEQNTSRDPLEVTHNIEVPQIEKTIALVSQALATQTKRQRRHHCRVCDRPDCRHYERYDLDTLEVFNQGYPYYDVDAPEKDAGQAAINRKGYVTRGEKLGSVK